jgi:hypothetical protein
LHLRHLPSPVETARLRDLLLNDQVVDPSESRSKVPTTWLLKDQVIAGLLRDSVMLCRALGRNCNGHPASVVVKNQILAIIKISKFSVPSGFEPGGRRFESVRARFSIKVPQSGQVPCLPRFRRAASSTIHAASWCECAFTSAKVVPRCVHPPT